MSNKIQVTIDKVECVEGTGRNGKHFKRYDVFAEGERYSTFKKPAVLPGDVAAIEFNATQFGNDIVSIQGAGSSAPQPAQKSVIPPNATRQFVLDMQTFHARKVALDHIAAQGLGKSKKEITAALERATQIEEWLVRIPGTTFDSAKPTLRELFRDLLINTVITAKKPVPYEKVYSLFVCEEEMRELVYADAEKTGMVKLQNGYWHNTSAEKPGSIITQQEVE